MTETIQDIDLESKREELQDKSDELAQELYDYLKDNLPGTWSVSEPFESPYCSSQYDVGTALVIEKDDSLIDVRIEMHSSEEYEGEMLGWSFGFGSTWKDGEVGPGATLFNFTDRIWTLDEVEIDNRIKTLERELGDFGAELVKEVEGRGDLL